MIGLLPRGYIFSDGSGLEFYDAVNRMYDHQIGRFGQIDPLADLSLSWSPFVYCTNNPINRVDHIRYLLSSKNGK